MSATQQLLVRSGDLDLQAETVVPDGAGRIVVLSHPHPQYGGDMWNPLIQFLFDAIPGSGDAVLRYNFRGTGESEGAYDNGVGEREDAAAAFDAATQLVDGPVLSVGWSFGAVVSLHADHDRLAGWVGIAAPLQMMTEAPASASQERPKLLLVPEHDQFCRPEAAVEATVGWNAATVVTLAGTDHSVAGRAQDVAEAIATFAR